MQYMNMYWLLFYLLGANEPAYISLYPFDDPSFEFMNAVYVDGFCIKDQFIATQFPLESTVTHFWRIIAEKKISLIVALNETDDEDKVYKFHISSLILQYSAIISFIKKYNFFFMLFFIIIILKRKILVWVRIWTRVCALVCYCCTTQTFLIYDPCTLWTGRIATYI